MFNIFRKKTPSVPHIKLIRREITDANHFEKLRHQLLSSEIEKSADNKSDFDRDPRQSYREFLNRTDCKFVSILQFQCDNTILTPSEATKQHPIGNELDELFMNEFIWLEDPESKNFVLPDIVLALLPEYIRERLAFYEPADLTFELSETFDPDTRLQDMNIKWIRNNRLLLDRSAEGTLLRAGRKVHLMPSRLFMIWDAIHRYQTSIKSPLSKDDRQFAWAELLNFLELCQVPRFSTSNRPLRIKVASQLSITLDKKTGKIIPYFLKANATPGKERTNFEPLLSGENLRRVFNQCGVDARVPPHFVLGNNTFVYLSPETRIIFQEIQKIRNGDPQEQARFFVNPTRELQNRLEKQLTITDPAGLIEGVFVESPDYLSDRIEAFGPWHPKFTGFLSPNKNVNWFPDEEKNRWAITIAGVLFCLTQQELQDIYSRIEQAIEKNESTIIIKDVSLDPASIDLEKIKNYIGYVQEQETDKNKEQKPKEQSDSQNNNDNDQPDSKPVQMGPILKDNLEKLNFVADKIHRESFTHQLIGLNSQYSLLPHQQEALQWLQKLWNMGIPGALLADDMGLGKTLQCLAFLRWIAQGFDDLDKPRPALVVAPVSLLQNWANESKKYFSGYLSEPLILTGKEATAALNGNRMKHLNRIYSVDWVLTNYETVRDKFELFGNINWSVIVFDEVQKIKNPIARLTEFAKSLKSDFTLTMTGTPIENSFADIWCIMDTAVPGVMGSLKDFIEEYNDPSNIEQKGAELHRLLSGNPEPSSTKEIPKLMLRRLKSDHIKSLPIKRTKLIKVPMPPKQAQQYKAILQAYKTNPKDKENSPLVVLDRLAKCSLSPEPLFDDRPLTPEMITQSGRLCALFQILDEIKAKREKVVIFVQHCDVQSVIAKAIQEKYQLDHIPGKINGSMSSEARQTVVNRFQNGPEGFDAVVLTSRAAGTGLTLTAANHVVHLERWWNPAVEDQCSDRVYRIGQDKEVTIHIPMSVFPDESDQEQSFDEKLELFLEQKRIRSASVLLPLGDSEIEKALL